MRLQRLTGLERDKLEAEYAELQKMIAYYRQVLSDEKMVFGIIKVAIILGLLVLAFEALNSALNILDADQLENAVVYGKLRELGGDIFPKLKELITGIDG